MAIFLFSIMILYLFYDFKYRRVPNHYFFLFLILGILFSLFELIINLKQFRAILMNKVIFFIISFCVMFYLFQIKIFGGADCKFLILVFLYTPYGDLSAYFYLFFYFYFMLFYFGLISISYLISKIRKNYSSFNIFFVTYNIHSSLKQIFFGMYFIFKDFVELKTLNNDKYHIACSDLIFNHSSFKLQVLFQYRAPLIPLIALAYFLCSLMILS